MKLINKIVARAKSAVTKLVAGVKHCAHQAKVFFEDQARAAVGFAERHAPRAVAMAVTVVTLVVGAVAQAQTDATVIATNAQSAFVVIAPITITIAGFYVILKIAKKVVH